jgi:hypothetical protein
MNVRAKFMLMSVKHMHWGGSEYQFSPQYDPSIPEDQRFAQASPSGSLTITVDNPAVHAAWKVGEQYYLDFTPVPEPAAEAA